jgi:NAD(P)-dependent dehydrogenase (short-subunit alcohol dehydrogenase family)
MADESAEARGASVDGDRSRHARALGNRRANDPRLRVAVVTGASSGIGAELVRRLQADGSHVVGLSRRPSDADEHEECDVGDREAVEAVATRVLERHPQIGLLVCNAGFRGASSFLDGDVDQIEQMVRVNYLGSLWTVRAFLPGLGRGSHLVLIVSVAGTFAGGPYSASKHAQLALSRSLAVELAPRGVSVHIVNPGLIETEGFQHRHRFGRLTGRLVADTPLVASRVLDAVEHDRSEIFVPRWYRPFAWAQALAPGTVARARSLRARQ